MKRRDRNVPSNPCRPRPILQLVQSANRILRSGHAQAGTPQASLQTLRNPSMPRCRGGTKLREQTSDSNLLLLGLADSEIHMEGSGIAGKLKVGAGNGLVRRHLLGAARSNTPQSFIITVTLMAFICVLLTSCLTCVFGRLNKSVTSHWNTKPVEIAVLGIDQGEGPLERHWQVLCAFSARRIVPLEAQRC